MDRAVHKRYANLIKRGVIAPVPERKGVILDTDSYGELYGQPIVKVWGVLQEHSMPRLSASAIRWAGARAKVRAGEKLSNTRVNEIVAEALKFDQVARAVELAADEAVTACLRLVDEQLIRADQARMKSQDFATSALALAEILRRGHEARCPCVACIQYTVLRAQAKEYELEYCQQ